MPSFPFDVVFVFNGHVPGAMGFAKSFYSDLTHDGFFTCFYDKHSSNGTHRVFVGIGGSDRLLHALCTTFHLSEEYQAVSNEKGLKRIYAQTSRQRIIYRVVKIRSYGGPHACFATLKESGILVDHFCLHDPKEVEDILAANRKYWLFPSADYINDIEGYFGEEFAFFIGWLRSVVIFALPLMVLYIVCFAFQISDNYRSWSMIVAGFVCPCYLQLMHENWKRMEKELALEFGTLNLEYCAEVQPEFKGKPRPVSWKETKTIEREGNENIEMVVPGNFQLPIQHSFPIRRKGDPHQHHGHHLQTVVAKAQNPFDMSISTAFDFSTLPEHVNENYYPNWKRLMKLAVSIPTVICFTVAVVVAIYLIEILRNFFADPNTGELSPNLSIAASVVNSVAIVVLNQVYPIVARKLAQWQNFRTQQETEDAYIFKIFVFVFVNSYFPIFLNAFDLYIVRQSSLDKRKADQKTQQLFVQLLTACISTVIVSNIMDVAMPFLIGPLMEKVSACLERCKGAKDEEEPASPASPTSASNPAASILDGFTAVTKTRHVFEHQIKQAECAPILPRFQGRIILLGFAALFAAVFPLGVVFVVVDAMLVMRLEIVRYLLLMRRGLARQVDSIGNWKMCIQFIIIAATVTNCLLCVFVTDVLHLRYGLKPSYEHRLRWFIITEHIMLAFVFGIEHLVPDLPMSIRRIEALQVYSEMQKTGRLQYNGTDLYMPKTEVIPSLHAAELQNDRCAVCSKTFVQADIIRNFPCIHAIHDDCIEKFVIEYKDEARTLKMQSRAVTLREETAEEQEAEKVANAEGRHEVVCLCPICHIDIDCRFFEKITAVQEYVPVRNRMIAKICRGLTEQAQKELTDAIAAEHSILRSQLSHFGLQKGRFQRACRSGGDQEGFLHEAEQSRSSFVLQDEQLLASAVVDFAPPPQEPTTTINLNEVMHVE